MHRIHALSLASASILGLAFAIMLLVSLSLPIIKGIYILQLVATPFASEPATNTANVLRFGVWGVCAYGAFDKPNITSNTGTCFGPMLGYTIPENILELTGYPSLVHGVDTGVTALLILHPVASLLSLLTALFALLSIRRHTHNFAIATLVLALLTALTTTAVLIIDLVLIGVAQAEVPGLTSGEFTPGFGPVTWMMVVAALLTYVGMVVESVKVCGCCGVGRYHHHSRGVEDARGHRYETRRQTMDHVYQSAPRDESVVGTVFSGTTYSTPSEKVAFARSPMGLQLEEEQTQEWWWYWPPSWWSSSQARS